MKKAKTIKVDCLARVEGEGGLYIKIKDGELADVRLNIFEPPRFFEALLRGRMFSEAPDITARICGICPVAYQMSAVNAIERAFGVKVDGQLRALRRLLYCGEWIESHTLHIYMLHAPDFLGYESALHMAKDYPEIVERGLKLKKAGNAIMTLVGGREVHPINVRVGGFYRTPELEEFKPLIEELEWAKEAAIDTIRLTGGFPFPDLEQDYEFVSMTHPEEYPINEGRIVSNRGLDIDVSEYENHFVERHVKHSNALHSVLKNGGKYFVGPMARFNINFEHLTPLAKKEASKAGLAGRCLNPFKSIIVRSVELLYACEEALRIIDAYKMPKEPYVEPKPKGAVGYGSSEAPRGVLYHRYRLDDNGAILDARIVPPTSQNQGIIEDDLFKFIPKHLHLPEEELKWRCEQAIRNYDPCISCATHFLKLNIEKG